VDTAEEGFTEWNARLYRMPPIIDYFESNKSYVFSRTKMNRFGSAGLYFLRNDDAKKWLVGERVV
jgi:hypothetical protein